ncbi:MAG: hypothetical protein A2202_02825 [Bdellovibrionales bacterium RIFOXYA1_FULL_36_14]|nr:MAG: hypothetical protein A2202_02825 [Bdellovibrionales bacterium RIFOXYA1_FULL_36_14]
MKSIFILILVSVSLHVQAEKKKPAWISDLSTYCKSSELCTVGEAVGMMQAESSARKEMSKIFMTQIKSKNTLTSSGKQVSVGDQPISGSFEEDMYGEIEEKTEGALRGVIIKDTYETSDSFYALAILKKSEGAQFLKSEMEELDKNIVEFYKDGRRNSLNKALKIMQVRDGLNINYEFLQGNKYPSKVTYQQVMEKKNKKRSQNVVVFLKVSEPSEKGEIRDIIIAKLLEDDFKVVTENKNHKYKIEVEVKKNKEYLKVEGFEKYKFMLRINSFNQSEEKLGSLEFDKASVGRDYSHAYSNVLPDIMDFIIDKIGELNID